jgi:hypothetical protein
MLNESGYGVAIRSITLGDRELLNFTEESPYKYTVGFLDSGATCLQLPDGVFPQGGGVDTYRSSPFGGLVSPPATEDSKLNLQVATPVTFLLFLPKP